MGLFGPSTKAEYAVKIAKAKAELADWKANSPALYRCYGEQKKAEIAKLQAQKAACSK